MHHVFNTVSARQMSVACKMFSWMAVTCCLYKLCNLRRECGGFWKSEVSRALRAIARTPRTVSVRLIQADRCRGGMLVDGLSSRASELTLGLHLEAATNLGILNPGSLCIVSRSREDRQNW